MQICADDFLSCINRALDGMLSMVEALGDERINLRPDLPGANSPYVILAHCVGLTHYWMGGVLAGRPVQRDRDAEFRARGTVAEIRQAVRDLQTQLPHDISRVEGDQPIAFPLALAPRHHHMRDRRQGAILMHTYEELAQHHGQMEIVRDLLRRKF